MTRYVKILLIVAATIVVGFILLKISSNQKNTLKNPATPEELKKTDNVTDPPRIVSTNPSPLEDMIVSATQALEITFNRPLQNSGEFKFKIEPKVDIKIELSSDRKTAKITPLKPYELGATYTITIGTDTKFEGMGNWGQDKIYHFKTVKYTGV